MRLLKGITKFFEGILLLLIPLILFFWFLSVINLQFTKPFEAILGAMFNPYLASIKALVQTELVYSDTNVDFAPLILSAIVLAGFFVFFAVEKILDIIDNTFNHVKKQTQETQKHKEADLMRIKFIEELARNKVIYLSVKFKQKATSSAYLYREDNDFFGAGILGTMINDICLKAKDFNAKRISDFKGENNTFYFVFYDIVEAIDYAFFINNKTVEINRDVLDQGKKLYYLISCHCAYSEHSVQNDLTTVTKLLSLGKDNEIVVSELFKNKYEALKESTNLIFNPRGIYNINNDQIEIFQLIVK